MRRSFMVGALLAVIGVAGFIFSSGGGDGFFRFNLATIDQSERFPSEGIVRIEADIESADIRFEEAAGDEIEVRLEGRNAKRYADKIKLHAETEGDTLRIRAEMPKFQFGIVINEANLRVAVPAKRWGAVALRTGSGDMTLEGLRAASVTLETGSGDMLLDSIESERLSVKAGSGDIDVTGYRGGAADVFAASGDVRLEGVEGKATVETASGDVEYEGESVAGDTVIRTGSGDVTVALDEEPASLAVDFRTSAGDATIEFDGLSSAGASGETLDMPGGNVSGRFGDGAVKLDVRTDAGDIELERR